MPGSSILTEASGAPLSRCIAHVQPENSPTPQTLSTTNLRDVEKDEVEEQTPSSTDSSTRKQQLSLPRQVLVICITALASLLTHSGLALAVAPLSQIGTTLGITPAETGRLSWLPAAYSLTVGTFLLPSGRWGDIFGYRTLFIAGFAWFASSTLLAGLAALTKNFVFFAFCRAMQGIGPALIVPNGVAMLARLFPEEKKKAVALSIFGAVSPAGFVFGALLSGLLTQYVWWPWAYWCTSMLLTTLCALAFFIIPPTPGTGLSSIEQLDLVGSGLGVAGLVMVNFAFNQGPVAGWQEPYVYVMLVIGIVTLCTFLAYEMKVAKYPLIPSSALTKAIRMVLLVESLGWSSFGIWMFYLWQMFQHLRHQSILESTAQMVPCVLIGFIVGAISSFVLGRCKPGFVMLLSMAAFLVASILLATLPPDQLYWKQLFWSFVAVPWGMNLSFPAGMIILSNQVDAEFQGIAASLVNTMVHYSVSIALGFAATIQTHVSKSTTTDPIKGYRAALYFAIGLAGLAMISSLVLVHMDYRKGK